MDCNEAKKLVIKAGHELVRSGLIARTWGNVSCRIDNESFVITPSGREYLSLTPNDIVEVKINDLSYSGSIKPSSEKGIHSAAYRIHPEINFVIHTHQENASAISATDLDYFRPSAQYSELDRTVVCAKYALPGTKALCSNVTDALEITSGHGMILKHHGTLCIGETYEGAFLAAKQLEEASGIFINENGGGIQTEAPVGDLAETLPVTEEAQAILSAWKTSGNKRHDSDQ